MSESGTVLEEEIIYSKGKYHVSVSRNLAHPSLMKVFVKSGDPFWVYSRLSVVFATTKVVKWWQFWLFSAEEAIERARAIVDSYAGSYQITDARIAQKIEELKLRQKAIQELENEEAEKEKKTWGGLEAPHPHATSLKTA